ncbi:MAG TPA: acyl-CoA dehydrogenase family protein [Polyangiales bacterium]|nr:acyl-CoA dehydrogenase family protein [Polyangiales bacterium]
MSKSPISQALAALNKIAGSEMLHKLGLYEPATKIAYHTSREGFRVASSMARQFKSVQKLVTPERLPKPERKSDLFDLSVSEEQQMIRDMAQRFAKEAMREAAPKANDACAAPDGFAAQFAELGLAQFAVPESLGGTAAEASVCTGVLVAEDLAQGDVGLALAALAPIGVANALVRWGSADQQAKYLPAFAESTPPHAAIAIAEPRPLFDPNELRTRATIDGDGFLVKGEKSLVPLAESAELLLVAASLVGKGPRMFVIERGTPGVKIVADPAMGARAASLGKVILDDVRLPSHALLGEGVDVCDFSELVDLSRLSLCALSVGCAQAVLDYVIQYCNDRQAFGEPISHRQAVAFMIANIGIEVESMRLLTWRAASRAEQGLSFHREAYLARVICAEKGMEIGTNGVQLLGGHGFIKEHPVERWYRDLMALSVMEGGLLL